MYLGYLYPDSFDVFSLQLITILFTEDLECLTYNIIKDRPIYSIVDVTKSVGNFLSFVCTCFLRPAYRGGIKQQPKLKIRISRGTG